MRSKRKRSDGAYKILSCIGRRDILSSFEKQSRQSPIVWYIKFGLNYICLTSILFAGLLAITNFSAYQAIAADFLQPEKLASVEDSLAASVLQASQISDTSEQKTNAAEEERRKDRLQKVLEKHLARKKVAVKNDAFSVERFNRINDKVELNFEITPYEDRIIIPRIGKNIPLVNVENQRASTSSEWHKIFMKELDKGVIKYPGSADPGHIGNSFIFGHSSNFPWARGKYNQVFALLDKLEQWDEIITYHNQKKFVYRVRYKQVVKPGYVNALKGDEGKKLMTLMTCWPIGTTLNRLLVIAELDELQSSESLASHQNHVASSM